MQRLRILVQLNQVGYHAKHRYNINSLTLPSSQRFLSWDSIPSKPSSVMKTLSNLDKAAAAVAAKTPSVAAVTPPSSTSTVAATPSVTEAATQNEEVDNPEQANEAPVPAAKKKKGSKKSKKSSSLSALGDDPKGQALLSALKQIEKSYGKGTLMKLGDKPNLDQPIDVISTGSLAIDAALGVGGLPKGRIVEIYGPESSGKTSLALSVIAQAQKNGGKCTFIDAEHALDPHYAKVLGVNLNELYVTQPDSGEQALEIADCLVRSGGVDVIVIDSVAALTPRNEIEGEMGVAPMASQARLMSQALRKMTASVSKTNCLLIFINQIRSKVGVTFGSPEVTSGGNALKFYASVRLDIRKGAVIKEGAEKIIGSEIKVKVVKNKVAPPFRVAKFEMYFGEGISTAGEIIDMGVEHGLIAKKGAWYYINSLDPNVDEPLASAQGKANLLTYLKENPDVVKQLRDALMPQLTRSTPVVIEDESSEEGGEEQA